MRKSWMLLVGLALAAMNGVGCASDCTKIRGDFDETVSTEAPFVETMPAEGPLHLGVTVRVHVLDQVVDHALAKGLETALSFADDISLATGQKIGIVTKGEVADIGLYPDKSCEACLRVDGRLGGEVTVKLPVLGSQRVPLKGTFSLVAPVEFATTESGEAVVQLDLAKVASLGKSHVRPEVTELPPTWWKVIESPLGKLMIEAATKNLKPVSLFRFQPPDLGVEGLKVVPARIVSDAKHGTVFAGFRTNVAAAIGADEAGLKPLSRLGKNDDVAVGVDPRILGPLSTALVRSGKISRTWTKDGKPSPDGPIHVTIQNFSFEGDGDSESPPFTMNFRAWHLPAEGKCWWADVVADGRIEVRDHKLLAVAIDSAKVHESSMPKVFNAVANWTTSKLVLDSSKIVTKALAREALRFPGGTIDLKRARLSSEAGAVWLSGRVDVQGEEP